MASLKDSVNKIASALGIPSEEFKAVGIYEWPSILQKIERAFVIKKNSNTRFNWWWESFKGDQYQIDFEKDNAFEHLNQFISDKEKAWFVACDSDYDPSKFWLFEGYVNPIQKIIGELPAFEYYLVSKRYDWLICESDHGVLIGLGSIIPRMKQFRTKNNVA
jgi:hypothetical protein